MMTDAEKLYIKVSHIIKNGNSYIHATDRQSYGHPSGTQTVARYSLDRSELLLVIHSMHECRDMEIDLGDEYVISDMLYADENIKVNGNTIEIKNQQDICGNVVYLKKK